MREVNCCEESGRSAFLLFLSRINFRVAEENLFQFLATFCLLEFFTNKQMMAGNNRLEMTTLHNIQKFDLQFVENC